ncbi:tyrosine-type recombinase/integrase [Candidatus Saccharibacteria bacterium]|nr:tyrosine-type recombinase/integrase [Candidatus Saccharibacteria bacterium]
MKIDNQIIKYLNYCKSIRQMSLNTLNNKRAILNQFVKNTEITSATELDNQIYNKWLELKLRHHLSPASVNIYNSTIVSFLKFHQNAGLEITFDFNLVPYFRAAKTSRKFYTDSEISQVLKYADESEGLMITIMFETGMRIAEIANLKVENLNGTKISFVGKGGKMRVVYLSINTSKNLRAYLKKYHIKDGYIWCVLNGVKTLNAIPPTINTIRKNLQNVFQKAGFGGFYPHALRHSFATNLQKKGASVMEIKEMMGHSSIATTERYLHGFDGKLEELFKKYQ